MPPTLGEVASRRDDGEGKNAVEQSFPYARKKTKTDVFCRHKRKFHRNEKDVAKSLQKYCKIYYEIHQSLGSTLVQSAKKWNKIGRK